MIPAPGIAISDADQLIERYAALLDGESQVAEHLDRAALPGPSSHRQICDPLRDPAPPGRRALPVTECGT
jgi:hypothetical protein